MCEPITKQLSNFLGMQREYITNVTIIALRNILRKFPQSIKNIEGVLAASIDFVSESESQASLIWILGEFGTQIEDAPYLMENFINNDEIQSQLEVKEILLTACIRLFLLRPPEMFENLTILFRQILTNSNEDIDLKDRASFYYRAMQNNIDEFKTMFLTPLVTSQFIEE